MPYADGVYTPPTGAENAAPGAVIRSATWDTVHVDMGVALTKVGQGVNIQAIIRDSNQSLILTGVKGSCEVPMALTINSWKLLADQSGSIVVDIWGGAIGSYPFNSGNSITGSAPPTITSAQSASSSTLTGWSVNLAKGSILTFNVVSCTAIQQVTVSINCGRN